VTDYETDGIFVDGAVAGDWGLWSNMGIADELNEGVVGMIEQAREKLGPDKLITFNGVHAVTQPDQEPLGSDFFSVTDGPLIDNFDRDKNQSKEYMAGVLDIMSQTAQDDAVQKDKIILFKAWPGFTWRDDWVKKTSEEELYQLARERIIFPLAAFLVAAEPNCYFCYTYGWHRDHGTFWWYPEFDKPLGPPKGQAVRKGWTYTREFAHASVFVGLEKKTAKIDWK